MVEANSMPTLPSEAEAILAKESGRVLAARPDTPDPLELRLSGHPGEETVKLPASAVRMLVRILEEMAHGNAVALVPIHAEVTTQEAADLLNISRASVIQLVNEGKIPNLKVGTRHRIRLEELMAYKRQTEADRQAAIEQFIAYNQELGI